MSENVKDTEQIRVGVFVCHCGSNIGGVINCKGLAEFAKALPNVAYAEDYLYACAETGLISLKNAIQEHGLNRVVIASCTPRTHEPLFRESISEAGLNPFLFNFVNIREQCTWVHMDQPVEAFEKAKDLISMGVAKAVKLEPLDMITIVITPAALVIGAGVTGMSAALSLSRQGFKTYLVEKEEKLGGRLNSLYKLFPHDMEASELLEKLKGQVGKVRNLEVYKAANVKEIRGYVGNFSVEIALNGSVINLIVGTIIVAVGASLFTPTNLFGYDSKKRITQHELESKLKNKELDAKNTVMIQCVGSRNDERPYCASVCCMTALKNALIIKNINPKANIVILYRDMYAPGTLYEDYYRKARLNGILFIRYDLDKEPVVEENQIKVFDVNIGEEIIIPYDLLVLSTPLIANIDNKELAQDLKVPLEMNEFFLEAHVKLRPVDFATEGVFIGGSAKWPVDVSGAITQGYATAARASTILSKKELEVSGSIAEIDESKCKGCGDCRDICLYNAIETIEMIEAQFAYETVRDSIEPAVSLVRDKSRVLPAVCKGCGVCVGICPNEALTLKQFKDQQLGVMLKSYLG